MTMSMWMIRLTGRGKLFTECPPQQLLPHTAINAVLLLRPPKFFPPIQYTAADGVLDDLPSLSEIADQ